MKAIYLYSFGKKVINSCKTEAQLVTAKKWVAQIGCFNTELAVALSYELSEKVDELKK